MSTFPSTVISITHHRRFHWNKITGHIIVIERDIVLFLHTKYVWAFLIPESNFISTAKPRNPINLVIELVFQIKCTIYIYNLSPQDHSKNKKNNLSPLGSLTKQLRSIEIDDKTTYVQFGLYNSRNVTACLLRHTKRSGI